VTAQAVAERQEAPVANVENHPASDSASLLQVISRAASDPSVDIDKMERLMQMHERLTARTARAAFVAALAEMQPKLPVVDRRGKIEVREKDKDGKRTGELQQSTPYALWEDINEAIRPLLAEYGFALSFRVKKDADRVEVTGVLSHREGHFEETTLSLPMDTTGSKNNVQAIGSSTSYGKRYTAIALLNVTSRGEDDDGKTAGAHGETVSPEQAKHLLKLIEDAGATTDKFCAWARIEAVTDLQAKDFDRAVASLKGRIKRREATKVTVPPNFDAMESGNAG